MAKKSICHILREREIYGRPIAQATLRELHDLDGTRSVEMQHDLDDVNYELATKILGEYKCSLTTTGVTQDQILEIEQVERIRQLLPYRFQAIGNWWDFLRQLVNLADKRSRWEGKERIDCELTVNCAIDCERSTQSILKSQRFRLLFRVLKRSDYLLSSNFSSGSEQSDDDDDEDENEWWCNQLIKLFEQHEYNIL